MRILRIPWTDGATNENVFAVVRFKKGTAENHIANADLLPQIFFYSKGDLAKPVLRGRVKVRGVGENKGSQVV